MKINPDNRSEIEQSVSVLENQTKAIMKSVEDLKKTGLNEDLLVIAIQQSAKKYHTGLPVSAKYIRFILKGIGSLDMYMFPDKYNK